MTGPGLVLSSFLVGLSGALAPGPLTTLAFTESARYGARAGILMALGHSLLELLTVLALAFGLGAWLGSPAVAGSIGLVGTVVLLWLGYLTLRSARGATLALAVGRAGEGGDFRARKPLASGVVVSLANPYWSLWWATIGTTYLAMWSGTRAGGLAAFYAGHVLADISWLTVVSVVAAGGRRLLGDRAYRVILMVLGAFLVALGVYCGVTAVRLLS